MSAMIAFTAADAMLRRRWHSMACVLAAISFVGASAHAAGPSLTDVELGLLCDPAAPAPQSAEAQAQAQVQIQPSVEELEREIEELDKQVIAAERERANPSPTTSNLEISQRLEDLAQQRRALQSSIVEQGTVASPEQPEPAAAEPVSPCSPRAPGLDRARREAIALVCEAHENRRAVSWHAAQLAASCLRDKLAIDRASTRSSGHGIRQPLAERRAGWPGLGGGLIRGATEFRVEQPKAKMSSFAAEAIGRRLCDKGSDSATLFERTCQLLALDGQPGVGATPAALREAARADLEDLPHWAAKRIGRRRAKLACAVELAWSFAQEAMKGGELIALVSDLDPLLSRRRGKSSCVVPRDMRGRIEDLSAALRRAKSAEGVDLVGLSHAGQLDYALSRIDPSFTDGDRLGPLGQAVKEVLRRIADLGWAIEALERDPSDTRRSALVPAGLRSVEPVLMYALDPEQTSAELAELEIAMRGISQLESREYAAAVVSFSALEVFAAGANAAATQNSLGFGAALAQADSADGVRIAFDDATAPLHSFRRKNERRWGATLTGMVGFLPAYEVVVEAAKYVDDGSSIAPALLLGIDVHRGFGSQRVGVLASILDLGALATTRLKRPEATGKLSQADRDPDVRIEQVFTPGVYAYYGRGPFDFGLGASFVPSLRPAREARSAERRTLNVVRLGLLLTVDISMLPLL